MKNFLTFLTEGVNDPAIFKCIYVVGPAGSGKTTIGKKLTSNFGYRWISSDEIFEYKAGKVDMHNMDAEESSEIQTIRKQSRRIMYRKRDSLIEGRMGLFIDTPGYGNYILEDKSLLESMGYQCMMIFVQVDLDTSLERNQQRDRTVPEDAVKGIHSGVMKNRDRYKKIFGDNFVLIKNDNYEDVDLDEIWKQVKKFTEKPLTRIAQKWIERQNEKSARKRKLDATPVEPKKEYEPNKYGGTPTQTNTFKWWNKKRDDRRSQR